jgi:hypothetical protein
MSIDPDEERENKLINTNASNDPRIVELYELMLKGYNHHEILRYSSKWSCSSRTIDKLIRQAKDLIIEINKKNMEQLRAEATLRYLRWMRKCEELQSYDSCARMQQRIDKINGLEERVVRVTVEENKDKSLLERLLDD